MLTSESLRDSFKYLFRAELPFLKALVQSLPDKPFVVNIGAGAGTSGLAIMESRPDVMLLTIDKTDLSSPFGCLEAERDVMKRAGYDHEWDRRWFQLHANSADVPALWGNGFQRNDREYLDFLQTIDMVFVDGDHSYEGCKADILGWMPLIRAGGIMAIHDYLKSDLQPDPDGPHPKNWPGVDQAVQELLIPHYPVIAHVDSLIAFRKEPL